MFYFNAMRFKSNKNNKLVKVRETNRVGGIKCSQYEEYTNFNYLNQESII